MLQVKNYFGQFDAAPEVTEEIRKNAAILLAKVSEVCSLAGVNPVQTGGFRTLAYNAQIRGARNSAHCFGMAVDLHDPDKKLAAFCIHSPEILVERGLHIESPFVTCASENPQKRWIHFQTRRPKSGATIFIP